MFDDLKNMATGALGNAVGAGGIMQMLAGMTDLDDKAIVMLEEKFGKEKVDTIKASIMDGKVDINDMENIASEFGVPKEVLELLVKFYQK